MIGVTIGINPIYEALAILSARCLKETTGLETLVLKEKDLLKSGFAHPAALKLILFDLVKDDDVLYFDADWFSIQNWNPLKFQNTGLLTACNDFILETDWPNQYSNNNLEFCNESFDNYSMQNIRKEYVDEIHKFSGVRTHCLNWINTGLWIANRNSHRKWLMKSLDYYKKGIGHHSDYYEQPAMNKAIEDCNIKVHYLKRKYNTLVATRCEWPSSIIGLHVKIKHHDIFIEKVLNEKINSLQQVRQHFIKE